MLTPPRLEGTVTLADGRRLTFAEYGVPHGRAVIWLHGTPGGRRQIPQEARLAAVELKVRLVSLERPGTGGSTPHLYEAVQDFAADVEEVVEILEIEQFCVVGLSGGGPFALACAAALAPRVRAAAILGGVAPSVGPDAAGGGVVALAARFQSLLTHGRVPLAAALSGMFWVARPIATPGIMLYAAITTAPDRRVLNRPEFRAMFIDDIRTGGRLGLRAPVYDIVLFGRTWGFSLRDVAVPVRWWHGDADHIVPFRHGEHMVELLPDAVMHVFPGESHLGSLGDVMSVLTDLLETWDRVG